MDTNSKAKKSIFKKWWFWLIIVVALIGIGGALGGGEDKKADNSDAEVSRGTSNGSPSSDTSSQKPADTPADQLTNLAVGTAVVMDGVTVSVNSITDGPVTLGIATYEVNVTYKNDSGKLISVTPYDWTTVLRSGSDKAHVGGDGSFNLENINSGKEFTGNVILWGDGSPEKVKFAPSLWTTKEATWVLGQ